MLSIKNAVITKKLLEILIFADDIPETNNKSFNMYQNSIIKHHQIYLKLIFCYTQDILGMEFLI